MNWAIVGVGGSGRGHAKEIAKTEGLTLVGFVDIDRNAAEESAVTYNVEVIPTLEALCARADVDGVTIATPSALHAEHACPLLASGKHVLIEKPFALDSIGAYSIQKAAAIHNRLALPFHNRRWDADFRMVLDLVRAGTLGDIRVVRSAIGGPSPDAGWRLNRAMGGGRLNDWGPHVLAQIYEWFGEDVTSISGFTTNVNPENECEDLFEANLRFGSDVLVSVMMSGFSHLTPPRWEVIGSEGTLQLTGNFHGEFTLNWKRADSEFTRTYVRRDVSPLIPIYSGIVDHCAGRGSLPVTLQEDNRVPMAGGGSNVR